MDDKMSMTTIFKQFFLTILVVNYTKDKTKKYQLLNARVTQSNEKMVQSPWHAIGLLDCQCCLIPINTFC